ncbi:FKBP-type peptidyl-prolyl cis-trans isomerase [Tenacibaculum sp. L6]|uniref:FKBP-type peptidyl-prolyl cis-trans isomerase n=1 Tax=Tenacibaculum sp. L6 TaxID=2992764 RepID=UPI00237B42D1|nr:FKBP-type peptidyl-prolyl cis-trans isomerase [Tenacibaculum sp. L6]MDE0534953.1 FKBP-type peptidyl-prolyl cis-trans isomerase [Tenacibaculum sp. L6]
MKHKTILFILITLVVVVACEKPEARRPKQHGTTNFYNEVLKENKKLLASPHGFWYTYVTKDTLGLSSPEPEDVVLLSYSISDMSNGLIYERREKTYKVDKEDFIPALQEGVKLMKKGETITFVIPSYRAFGVTGDGNKIAVNQPIQSTVTLIDIKSKKDNEIN